MLVRIVDIYAKLRPEEKRRFEAEIERDRYKEVRDMVITWEEALADSEARGIQLGLRAVLKRQLKRRFGDNRKPGLKRLAGSRFPSPPRIAIID